MSTHNLGPMVTRDEVAHSQQSIGLKKSQSKFGADALLKGISFCLLPLLAAIAALLNYLFNVLPWDTFVHFTSPVIAGVAFWGIFTFIYMEEAGFDFSSSILIAVVSASFGSFSLCYTFGVYYTLPATLFLSSACAISLAVFLSGYLKFKQVKLMEAKQIQP